MSGESKVILMSLSDEEDGVWDRFEVDMLVALESQTLKNLIEDTEDETTIRLPNITSRILAMVIQYCEYHVKLGNTPDQQILPENEIQAWDAALVNVDFATLCDLVLAANYLDMTTLLDFACQTIANIIKDWDIEKIRRTFGITNDFTKEEEETVMKENAWAFTDPNDPNMRIVRD